MVRRTFVIVAVLTFALLVPAAFAGELEIHVINVGWGESILVRGPNGTTVLMDTGKHDQGTKIKDYLKTIGIPAATGLDYTITSHLDGDHVGGFDVVVGKGSGKYDVHVHNYYNGSTNCSTDQCKDWRTAAKSTTAKSPVVMEVGTKIDLGDGAVLTCIARNGNVIGGEKVSVKNENDRSIAALIQYRGFDYFWAGDMGGGWTSDKKYTGRHDMGQVDVESAVIKAILPGGRHPLISQGGIDVLQVSHHGSESSTSLSLLNGAAPAVAIISVGAGQGPKFQLPRTIVVDTVLGKKIPQVTVAAPLVLQTDEGLPAGTKTSYGGFSVGDIVVHTDGKASFTVEADGDVKVDRSEVAGAHLPRTFPIDETREP